MQRYTIPDPNELAEERRRRNASELDIYLSQVMAIAVAHIQAAHDDFDKTQVSIACCDLIPPGQAGNGNKGARAREIGIVTGYSALYDPKYPSLNLAIQDYVTQALVNRSPRYKVTSCRCHPLRGGCRCVVGTIGYAIGCADGMKISWE
jgi:hypothetical protein